MYNFRDVIEDASGGSRLEVSAKTHVTRFEMSLHSLIEMTWDVLTSPCEHGSVKVFDAWILVGLELSASPSQQVFDRTEIFLPYALILVKLRSAACQQ